MKPVELSKMAIELFIKDRRVFNPPDMIEGIDVPMAGTFVSIKTLGGELRGCIGTIMPTRETTAKEIVFNAIAAATEDPRFNPIEEIELEYLKISVDILLPPEPVKSITELDPKLYGVIVSSKLGRKGLLLPDLEGVDTVQDQIRICKMKAGISGSEHISLQRFKVERYFE